MVKAEEINKTEPVFPETTYMKAAELIGETISITDYKVLTSSTGDFLVLKATKEGQLISFSCSGKVIKDKLDKVEQKYGANKNEDVISLNEPLEGKLIYPTTKDGRRNYYDLE